MENITTPLYYMSALFGSIVFLLIFKRPLAKIFKYLLRGLVSVGGLLLLNLAGPLVGVTLTVNVFSVAMTVLLGMPGIAALLFINVIV